MADSTIANLTENASPVAGDWFVFELADNSAANKVNYSDLEAAFGATTVVKSADESVSSSTTLQDDDELTFPIGANETWLAEFVVWFDSNSTADIKFEISVPSGAVFDKSAVAEDTGSGGAGIRTQHRDVGSQVFAVGYTSAITSSLRISVIVINGANAGSVTLQWAQLTSDAGNTTVRRDSFLIARKVS